MLAPERFANWMSGHSHTDRLGHVYRYHPRSDAHSIALCTFVLQDLLEACSVLRRQAERSEIVYGINQRFVWPSTGKSKTLDLALGLPLASESPSQEDLAVDTAPEDSWLSEPSAQVSIREGTLAEVLLSCEAKSVMTEHGKSKPRVYDELSSSHEIVHQGRADAIACGITVVNIAGTFVSPLRQNDPRVLNITSHKQPDVAAGMVQHLRGLPQREGPGLVGFDAYCTFVVDCDNQGTVSLWTALPAPQPGDKDHYETFLMRMGRFYSERFGTLPRAR